MHPRAKAIARDVFRGDGGNIRVDLDEGHGRIGHTHGNRKAGSAHACAQLDHSVAATRRGRRREQDRVVADAMSGA